MLNLINTLLLRLSRMVKMMMMILIKLHVSIYSLQILQFYFCKTKHIGLFIC